MTDYPDDTPIRALPLSTRAVNVLYNTGLINAGAVREHIAEHGWAKIAKATNCGKRTLVEFKAVFEPVQLADALAQPVVQALVEAAERLAEWAEQLRASGDAGDWEWSQGDEYSETIAAIAAVKAVTQ